MDEIEQRLAKLFRNTRKAQGLDIRELSKRSGLSLGLISRIERELGSPTIQTVIKLCKGFDISAQVFTDELGLYEMNFDIPLVATLSDAGKYLRSIRKSKGKTQLALQAEVGISRNIQARIENGNMSRIYFSYLVKLDQALSGSGILPVFWAVYSRRAVIVDSQQLWSELLTVNNSGFPKLSKFREISVKEKQKMKKSNNSKIPSPNVEYYPTTGEFSPDKARAVICNPVYAGLSPFYPPILDDETWVRAAARMIREEGPEQFLVNMLYVLRLSLLACSEDIADDGKQEYQEDDDVDDLLDALGNTWANPN
jgi:transcriptional regulator with XRE-family HTH domain